MSQPDVAGGSLHRQDVHYENDRKAIMEISTADAGQIAPHATPCAKQPPAPFLSTNNARSATRGGKPSSGEMSLSSASAQQVPNAPQRTASAHRFHRSSVDSTHLRKANMEKMPHNGGFVREGGRVANRGKRKGTCPSGPGSKRLARQLRTVGKPIFPRKGQDTPIRIADIPHRGPV
jgi:hypothetical protein